MEYRSKHRRITIWTLLLAALIVILSIPVLLICIALDFLGWLFGFDDYEEDL